MKISYTEEMRRLLKVCGVPSGLVYDFSIDWTTYLRSHTEEGKDDGKLACDISLSDQKSTIKSLSNLDVSKPKIIVLNSIDELTLLRRFMVPWFYNAVEYCKTNPKASLGSLPVWHYIDFSFTDDLLTILRYKNPQINFSEYKPLLILDGVSTDSSSNKVEKLRDILNLSLDHAVVLLLGGANPYTFCKERLGFAPKQLAVFNSARNRTVL
jgi:hypothetical protein